MPIKERKPRALIYLVRHGETQENRDGIIQGQKDTFLNAMGERQAHSVGQRLKTTKIDLLISSDLQRAVNTADAIAAHHPGLEIVKQKELRERDMGPHREGLKLTAVAGLAPPTETSAMFSKRVMEWWNRQVLGSILSIRSSQEEPLTVVVTTHGGVITTLIKDLVGSRKARVGKDVAISKCFNASITLVEIGESGKGIITQYGDISHLSESALESNADIPH
ncbi:hypothetical protein D9613_002741 [Agrocybe pediades]|uniref:Phosphoglycerate mutase-like protein n=1 Tax=Agrocybe pediades TaxID=84607 RepID=A0A8H4QR99_9AGAR|nr:hypothetical protein D9613_002741 [Agrocybe pediades]